MISSLVYQVWLKKHAFQVLTCLVPPTPPLRLHLCQIKTTATQPLSMFFGDAFFFWLWLVSLVSAFDFPWQLCGLGCSEVEGQEIQLLFLCLFDSLLFSYFLSFFLCCHQGRSQKVAITRIAGLTTKLKTETETATETKTEYKALAIVTTPTSPRSE